MKSGAGQTTGGLIAPYSSPDEASQARRRVWWALGAFALGYALMLAFVLWGVFTEPSSSAGSAGSAGSGGSVYPVGSFVGPLVVLALTMAYRRKLDLAAGRKLTRQELTAIGDANAAGVVVAQADLVTAQEVAGRGALSVRGGVVLALFMLPVALFPQCGFS